ncbi:MAG TPA: NIPSNAP family protein [Verrucomicrobiales bacterium]|nr:NIPSNAP family protein [Verrucomicrobiales bacterium]
MNRRVFLAASLAAAAASSVFAADPPVKTCYELRVYTAAEGKLDALHARFRDHTCALFTKHGMTNVGYWVPLENQDRKLYYILSYPSREARDKSWEAFLADEEWKKASAESEKNGKLVSKAESTFLYTTDFSPAVKPEKHGATTVYELRTYTASAGNLPKLLERFRKFTVELFTKHGMKNFGYWTLDEKQADADKTLVYLLIHDSKAAADASFEAFRKDPAWVAAKEASEKDAGGSLTVKDGVKSIFMSPTDYSPAK